MRPTRRPTVCLGILVLTGALALGGCGDDAEAPAAESSSEASTTTEAPHHHESESTDNPSPSASEQPDDDEVVVQITVKDGSVDPAGEQVDVTVGQTVVLEVDSDAADELHVHSAPEEQEFDVKAADDQQFKFVAEQPGQFEVELHESELLVVQLVVQP